MLRRGPLTASNTRSAFTQRSSRPVCERHAVARMELFGFRASGHAHDASDHDFLVTFLPQANAGLQEMGGLKEDLEQELGHPIDLLSRTAVERSRNPFRRRTILAAPSPSMLSDKQNGLLRDILDSAAIIRSYLNEVSQPAFMSNIEKQEALLRRFEIIG